MKIYDRRERDDRHFRNIGKETLQEVYENVESHYRRGSIGGTDYFTLTSLLYDAIHNERIDTERAPGAGGAADIRNAVVAGETGVCGICGRRPPMSELKKCPICGAELKINGPEDWKPTFYDPDSGGDPYGAWCGCGFSFQRSDYDYAEFVAALNRRAQPENEPIVRCGECIHFEPYDGEEYKGNCNELVGLDSCMYEDDYCSYGERKPERSEGE